MNSNDLKKLFWKWNIHWKNIELIEMKNFILVI